MCFNDFRFVLLDVSLDRFEQYIPFDTGYLEKKLKQIIRKYCKPETSLKIVFTSLKLASFFSTKDKIKDCLRSWVIYKFSCTGCESSYVGRTTRHVGVRFHEHLYTDQSSHILKHLKKSKCLKQCREMNENCFKIFDTAQTKFSLKAMWLKWEKPDLNIHKKCVATLNLVI